MGRRVLNLFLLLVFLGSLGLSVLMGRDLTQRNAEIPSDMAYSPAYGSFAPNPNFPDGKTLQPPVPGTIPRGLPPFRYGPGLLDVIRAGNELQNPLGLPDLAASTSGALASPLGQGPLLAAAALAPGKAGSFAAADASVRERGAVIYTNYCQTCHGPQGKGDGPMAPQLTLRGVKAPTSLTKPTDHAVQMKDGEMFHVLTYGQGVTAKLPGLNMPATAAQLSREDRWTVIAYVRSLQTAAEEKRP
jgi:mono/diheme cytochrome c family protein